MFDYAEDSWLTSQERQMEDLRISRSGEETRYSKGYDAHETMRVINRTDEDFKNILRHRGIFGLPKSPQL